jgi:hypothetical protein
MYVLIRKYVDVHINFKETYRRFQKIHTYGLKNMVSNTYVHSTYDLKNMTCRRG